MIERVYRYEANDYNLSIFFNDSVQVNLRGFCWVILTFHALFSIMYLMNRYIVPILLAILVFALFASIFWFYETRYMVGRASISQASFSSDNSYVFVTPLQAKADGSERIRVSIFLLNNQGLGVMGKKITTVNNPKLIIDPVQPLTDDKGKAVFDVSSQHTGEYFLDILVDTTILPQKAHVSFK